MIAIIEARTNPMIAPVTEPIKTLLLRPFGGGRPRSEVGVVADAEELSVLGL